MFSLALKRSHKVIRKFFKKRRYVKINRVFWIWSRLAAKQARRCWFNEAAQALLAYYVMDTYAFTISPCDV
jgi:hypothetical protein